MGYQGALLIDGWRVDEESNRITRDGVEVKLEPKSMALLVYLAECHGHVVSRNDIEERVWQGRVVGYEALSSAIAKLRKAFNDTGSDHRVIETIPKKGYRLIAPVEKAGPPPEISSRTDQPRPLQIDQWKPIWVSTVALVALLCFAWWQLWQQPLPEEPSIAVLPFTNMSGDPEQEYFADGMTDDLITNLSNIPGLLVISRTSAFTYKGKAVKVRDVARELGVRYVLEGSIRRAEDQIRVNAQLIDGLSGGHVWAERYDRPFVDFFALQDDLTLKISSALAVNLSAKDRDFQAHRETDSTLAHDLFRRGWTLFLLYTPQDTAKAIPFFEQAIALDADYGRAHAAIAEAYWRGWNVNWLEQMGTNEVVAREKWNFHLQEAMKNPTPLAYQVQSKVFTDLYRWDDALGAAEHALKLNSGDSRSHETMARILFKVGRAEEALVFMENAIKLDPLGDYSYFLGTVQFHAKRFEEAAVTLSRSTKLNPDDEWGFIRLAAAYGQIGRLAEARSAIDTFNEFQARAGRGAYTLGHLGYWFFKHEADRELLIEGLRNAGLPEGNITVPRQKPKQIDGATTIDAVEAKRLYDRGVAFIDVRDPVWANRFRIPGAVHLEAFNVLSEASLSNVVGKDEEVVIFCSRDCKHDAGATAAAVSWGFTRVHYFYDGALGWHDAGYPMETPEN